MERLKAELRALSQHDTGTAETREKLIEVLLDILGTYFTPAGLATLNGYEARQLMILMFKDSEAYGGDEASRLVMSHIHVGSVSRQLPKYQVPTNKVVSIFQKR